MRKRFIFALIILALSAVNSAQDKSKKNTFRRLSQRTEIQGYSCASGPAWFYAGGKLRNCELAQEARFGEAVAPAGSFIFLKEDGSPSYVFLSRDTEIHGHTCRGVSHDLMTSFYPGGQLKVCWLASDQEIHGVPCAQTTFAGKIVSGTDTATLFYENGELRSCRVSRDATIQGRKYRRGDLIFLEPGGKVGGGT